MRIAEHPRTHALLSMVVLLPALVLRHGLLGVSDHADVLFGTLYAVSLPLFRVEQPRRMHKVGGQSPKDRQPRLDVLAVRVIVLCLLDDIEPSTGSRIIAYTGDVGPVAIVGRGVIVDEATLEEFSSNSPVVDEIVSQVAGHILPASVAEEATLSQLAHVCVDEGDTSSTLEHPRHLMLGGRSIRIPVLPVALELLLSLGGIRSQLKAADVEEEIAKLFSDKEEVVSPQQLKLDPVGVLIFAVDSFVVYEGCPDLAWRDGAVGQEGGHLGAVAVA